MISRGHPDIRPCSTMIVGELKTLAAELQDLVQAKVGTTKFAGVYNEIRQHVVGVRRERRNARVIQVRLLLAYHMASLIVG